jgi:hypothetical protein
MSDNSLQVRSYTHLQAVVFIIKATGPMAGVQNFGRKK